MKKFITLLALAMIFTVSLFAAPDGYNASYTPESNLVLTDIEGVLGATRIGFKIGTFNISFDSDWNGRNNLRYLSTTSTLTITGKMKWGTQTFDGSSGMAVKVNGTWLEYNNSNAWATIYSNVKGQSIQVEIYFLVGAWLTGNFIEGEVFTVNDPTGAYIDFGVSNATGNSSDLSDLVKLQFNGKKNGNNNTLVFADEKGSSTTYKGENPVDTNPVLYTSIDKKDNYNLGNLTKVELASIIAWGENLKDNTNLSIKITYAASKNGFELTHQDGDESIPYSLYAGNTSTRIQNGVAFNPGVALSSSNNSQANAREILKLYAQIDLTGAELRQKKAGSYSDIVYIEISVDE